MIRHKEVAVLTPLRKAGLAITGVAAVVLGVVLEEIEWRLVTRDLR